MSNQAPKNQQLTSNGSPQQTIKKQPLSRRRRGNGLFFDLLTAVFITASVVILIGTLLVVSNPDIGINPFPSTPLPTLFQTQTPTITLTPSATPTSTATTIPPTPTPSNTPTPLPSITPSPTISPTPVIPGLEQTVGPTATSERDNPAVDAGPNLFDPDAPFPFTVLTVRYEQNTRPSGCNWLSIAGTVTGVGGEAVTDLAVEVTGDDFEFITFTGSEPLFGDSGFEVQVGSRAFVDTYDVRLLGPDGVSLSDVVSVDTGQGCSTNVAVIEFVQVGDY
jgi:hypothetical protein